MCMNVILNLNIMNTNDWRPVSGYEGLYKINIEGEIVSLHKRNFNKQMPKRIDRSGYWTVKLNNLGKYSTVYVHRLLALAFIDNLLNKPFVNHINGNKLDYSLNNLEWVTASENMKHAYEHGLCYRFQPNNRSVIDKCTGQAFDSITKAAQAYSIKYTTLLGYLSGYRLNKTCLKFAS